MTEVVEISFKTLPEACGFYMHHPNAYAIILHETLNQSGTCKHCLQKKQKIKGSTFAETWNFEGILISVQEPKS